MLVIVTTVIWKGCMVLTVSEPGTVAAMQDLCADATQRLQNMIHLGLAKAMLPENTTSLKTAS